MKKKILCWALAAMLAFPATALAAEETETESMETERKATIMVVSITGNELTYVEINTPDEEESEPESGEMPEPESGDDSQAADEGGQSAEDGSQQGGPGGGGQMPDMSNMQDMMEQFQNGDVDMSGVQDMIEQFAGNGGGMRGGPGGQQGSQDAGTENQASEDDGQAAGDDSQAADEGSQSVEDGFQQGGPGGGQMPDMSNMQDMIEQFQNGDVDLSGMQDMIGQFAGNGGDTDLSGVQDMIEQFTGGGDGQEGGFGGMGGQGLTTVYLQVGVVVHADGKEKTFSILEAGDELEVLFETDEEGNEVITEMWLLDT